MLPLCRVFFAACRLSHSAEAVEGSVTHAAATVAAAGTSGGLVLLSEGIVEVVEAEDPRDDLAFLCVLGLLFSAAAAALNESPMEAAESDDPRDDLALLCMLGLLFSATATVVDEVPVEAAESDDPRDLALLCVLAFSAVVAVVDELRRPGGT